MFPSPYWTVKNDALFQVAVKALEKGTIQMELVAVLGMGEEGAPDISMGMCAMVVMHMVMLISLVSWEVELWAPISHMKMWLEVELLVSISETPTSSPSNL